MKILRYLTLALFLGFGLTACNNTADEAETIEVEDDDRDMERVESDPVEVEEDDDDQLGIDVKVDDEGNVDGEASGNVTIGDDDDD